VGVLPVDKPAGPTSHDVVDAARRALGERRIGHTGTLDPFASGLLLLCVGVATRLAEYLTGLPKSYSARARLGVTTDTLDPEGRVTRTSDAWRALTPALVRRAFEAHAGEREQRPPAFSAKKVGGERLYEKARRGEDVRPLPVRVMVYGIWVEDCELPDVDFALTCSSGTYVRAVARDVGESLGVGAHLTALRRTAIGPHRVEGALTPDELGDGARVRSALLSPLDALAHLPRVELDSGEAEAIAHGRPVAVRPDRVRPSKSSVRPFAPEPFVGALGQAAHVPPGAAGTASLAGGVDPALIAAAADPREEGAPIALAADGVLLAVARLEAGFVRPTKVLRAD
jgi:tRNA pseudouridine55 synthase